MPYIGLIITGTSGSGKTAISRKLFENAPEFAKVISLTTRRQRGDDVEGEYRFVTKEQFEVATGSLLVATRYRNEYYGIAKSDFDVAGED